MNEIKPSPSPLVDGFRRACRPPTPYESTVFFTEEALRELKDESKPEDERHKCAMRLLSCVPAIGERLPEAALNEILGRRGVGIPAKC